MKASKILCDQTSQIFILGKMFEKNSCDEFTRSV